MSQQQIEKARVHSKMSSIAARHVTCGIGVHLSMARVRVLERTGSAHDIANSSNQHVSHNSREGCQESGSPLCMHLGTRGCDCSERLPRYHRPLPSSTAARPLLRHLNWFWLGVANMLQKDVLFWNKLLTKNLCPSII